MADDALRKRQVRLERDLEQMGKVNPLAAREAEALEEREQFLATQMADVRASRKDLRQIVETVDEKIRAAVHRGLRGRRPGVRALFKVLFPNGNGRLEADRPDRDPRAPAWRWRPAPREGA